MVGATGENVVCDQATVAHEMRSYRRGGGYQARERITGHAARR